MDNIIWKGFQISERLGAHPYIIMMDVGMILSVLYCVSTPKISIILGVMHILYESFFKYFQKRVIGKTWRSFIMDFLFHYIPWNIMLSYIMNVPLADSFDALGRTLPIMVSCARIGCLLSGCCHGIESSYGILYHKEIFREGHFGCQKFSKNDDPLARVLPIQLAESIINIIIFFVLRSRTDSNSLIAYAWYYCISRIVLDIFRTSSARPRRCGNYLSEAQLLSLIIIAAISAWYYYTS